MGRQDAQRADCPSGDGHRRQRTASSNTSRAALNPRGTNVVSFGVPTKGRARARLPCGACIVTLRARGEFALFNRSHYEDVLVVRVNNLVPESLWKERYGHIRDFEELLCEHDTIVLKFFLHISKSEQERRLLDREKDPSTAWKLNVNDWRTREKWRDFQDAYEEVLRRCATPQGALAYRASGQQVVPATWRSSPRPSTRCGRTRRSGSASSTTWGCAALPSWRNTAGCRPLNVASLARETRARATSRAEILSRQSGPTKRCPRRPGCVIGSPQNLAYEGRMTSLLPRPPAPTPRLPFTHRTDATCWVAPSAWRVPGPVPGPHAELGDDGRGMMLSEPGKSSRALGPATQSEPTAQAAPTPPGDEGLSPHSLAVRARWVTVPGWSLDAFLGCAHPAECRLERRYRVPLPCDGAAP